VPYPGRSACARRRHAHARVASRASAPLQRTRIENITIYVASRNTKHPIYQQLVLKKKKTKTKTKKKKKKTARTKFALNCDTNNEPNNFDFSPHANRLLSLSTIRAILAKSSRNNCQYVAIRKTRGNLCFGNSFLVAFDFLLNEKKKKKKKKTKHTIQTMQRNNVRKK
jgi:hypothetical protein